MQPSSGTLSLGQNLLAEMRQRSLNIESNLLLTSTCQLDLRFKKIAFTDTCALATGNKRLLREMIGATIATPEPEDSISGVTSTNPGVLWVQFDQ